MVCVCERIMERLHKVTKILFWGLGSVLGSGKTDLGRVEGLV